MKKQLLFPILLISILLSFPKKASAQFKDWNDLVPGCVKDGIPTIACIPGIFQNIITAILMFSGVVALFFTIYAGIRFITSGGDPKQAEEAKKTLTFAIIGLVLILSSFFILQLIANFTGAQCITTFGFTNCQ